MTDMDIEPTLEERRYIRAAECIWDEASAIEEPCPRCGKKLIVELLDNGAIHCEDETCLSVILRGL